MENKYHIICSDHPNIELDKDSNVWNYLYPNLQKWAAKNMDYYVDSKSGDTVTYQNFISMSLCWAKEMQQYFYEDKIPTTLIMLPNSADYLAIVFGSSAIGSPMCPCLHGWSLELITSLIKTTQPAVIVANADGSLKFIIEALKFVNFTPVIYVQGSFKDNRFKNLQYVLSSKDELNPKEAGKIGDSNINIIGLSSGTTGPHKAIPITHNSMVWNLEISSQKSMAHYKETDDTTREIVLLNTPMGLVFGISHYYHAAKFGCRAIGAEEKDITVLYNNILQYRPTVMVCRPYVLEQLAKMKQCTGEDLKSLRNIVITGVPSNKGTFEKLKKLTNNKIIIQDSYGATDIGLISFTPLNQRKLTEMTGQLLPNVQARFLNLETGEDIRNPFEMGELLIRTTSTIIPGEKYINNPEATKRSFTSDGWFHTGDVGYFDEENFIKIEDRINDIITVGKKKVYPTRIENIILKHPSVIEVGVVGISNSSGSDSVKAFVVKKDSVEAEEIVKLVDKFGPPENKFTIQVKFVDEIPRNALGKVIRRVMKEM